MYIGPGQLLEARLWGEICPAARYYMRRKIGPPGGALCARNLTSLARCYHF
jgi:hypothetical protein